LGLGNVINIIFGLYYGLSFFTVRADAPPANGFKTLTGPVGSRLHPGWRENRPIK